MRNSIVALVLGAAAATSAAQTLTTPLPVQGLPAQSRGALIFDGIPPLDPNLGARVTDYLVGRDASFLAWLPDNSFLVSTRFADAPQVHRVIAPLGMREQLTWYPDPITKVVTSPAGAADGFAFLKEHDGDGLPQLYYYPLATHRARMLSTGTGRHGSPLWSADGKHVVFSGNERDGSTTDIYMADLAAGSPPAHLVVAGRDRPWYPADWSADGQKLLLWQPGPNDSSTLYIGDVNTGSVLPAEAPGVQHSGVRLARFAADGRGIYLSSVEDGDFSVLRYLDPSTHQARDVTAAIPWDIVDFQVGADGRYLAYVADDDGRDRLTVLDNQSKLELAPAGLPEGRITGLHFDHGGHQLAFSAESAQAPADVYVFDPEHNQATRWTHSETGVDPQGFVPAQALQYPTWDRGKNGQRLIPAFVYRPRTAGAHPVLIDIHDGPAGQFRPGFDAFIQFAVNELGYVVIAPNIRGSTGYGRSFADLDNGPAREDALRDLGALLVWIGMQKDLDHGHVAVMGQSYGGFMALAMLATYGDRLSGGIIVNGYASLPAYLADGSPGEVAGRRAEFGDERDPQARAALNRLSPLNSLVQIRKPVLVFQGLKDTSLQVQQAGQIVAGIRAQGGEAWYVTARDEGHDLQHIANRDAWLATVAQFLKKIAP